MIELSTLLAFTWGWIGLAAIVFLSLFFIRAPYGRHARKGWGPEIPSRVGWILMECPSLILMVTFFIIGSHQSDPAAWIFLGLWAAHYTNRSFIYPFRCRIDGKTMPLSIALMSILFNGINAGINGIFLFDLAPQYGTAWLSDPRFIIGVILFVLGMTINITSDNVLLRLRRDTSSGYSIPKGGLYRWISCPNYLGEIMEWVGFALATFSVTGLAFAIWTVANLAPRARSHHQWYRDRFDDYPEGRKALLPHIY
jgi:3-oxo-5-alpha-steroid 4-dehydrogenase 1